MSPALSSRPPSLRPATTADIDAIAELWFRAWPDGHRGHVPDALLAWRRFEDFRRWVPERVHETTVAAIDGWLAGFVTIHGDEVEQVYVAREARGGATGPTLLAHAEEAIAGQFDTAWLAVVPGNSRARRFYERSGWRDAGGLEYPAHIPHGRLIVPCRRYEKLVGGRP